MNNRWEIQITNLPDYHYLHRTWENDGRGNDEAFETGEAIIDKGYLHVVDESGRHGLVNSAGEIAVPCQYDDIFEISWNGAIVSAYRDETVARRERDKWQGRNKTAPIWQESVCLNDAPDGCNLSDALRHFTPRRYGVVDFHGKEILPMEYDHIKSAAKYTAKYPACKAGKWGAFDPLGKERIPCIYDDIWGIPWQGETAFLVQRAESYGIHDAQGRMILPCRYQELRVLPNDPASQFYRMAWGDACFSSVILYRDEMLWGAIDAGGHEWFPPCYESQNEASAAVTAKLPKLIPPVETPESMMDMTCSESELKGHIVNAKGERVDAITYDYNNCTALYGYVSESGEKILAPGYFYICPFGKRHLCAIRNTKANRDPYLFYEDRDLTLFDAQGKRVFSDVMKDFFITATGKIIAIPMNDRKGSPWLYDEDTKEIQKLSYLDIEDIFPAVPFYAVTGKKVNAWNYYRRGLIDGDGNVVLPVKYYAIHKARHTAGQAFTACKAGRWHLIEITKEKPCDDG